MGLNKSFESKLLKQKHQNIQQELEKLKRESEAQEKQANWINFLGVAVDWVFGCAFSGSASYI